MNNNCTLNNRKTEKIDKKKKMKGQQNGGAVSTQAPVVQSLDRAIDLINQTKQNKPRYPLDSDLSGR